jgi:hypothetical protein
MEALVLILAWRRGIMSGNAEEQEVGRSSGPRSKKKKEKAISVDPLLNAAKLLQEW